jgi:multisubunit Na+/H+ antiporter MnhE subunit
VSLLPGTVSVELGDDELELHVLDTHMPTERVLAALEERIGALFA